ncbi:hypothetical protein ElyMa_002591500 [Elysia marginata]|uniref:Uncharacterized protein n=1 Tax=Elysia marginata TaxID=1093978 RepID=A0AAV4H0H4_9GAST|nr:hypothetical protein ElyMa_002591500 [Elysia marginata]
MASNPTANIQRRQSDNREIQRWKAGRSWSLTSWADVKTFGSRASVASTGLVERRPQSPAGGHMTANAMRVVQMRPICSTRTLIQVTPGCREDSDTQQPDSVRRMSGCQEGHLTRAAKVG